MDPDIAIKFLPANTTSVIQPMDQAVLCMVKARSKKSFYLRLFEYVEQRPESCKTAFNEFVKKYTILDAIYDIAQAPLPNLSVRYFTSKHGMSWVVMTLKGSRSPNLTPQIYSNVHPLKMLAATWVM